MAIYYYRLLDLLNRRNMKKKDLLEILSPATISKLSNNKTVTTDTIDKLCKYLKCNPEDILEFKDDEEEQQPD